MEFNESRHVYLWGRNYNLQDLKNLQPIMNGKNNEYALYLNLESQDNLFINTLEGMFVSNERIDLGFGKKEGLPGIIFEKDKLVFRLGMDRKKVMSSIEKRYHGKFFNFKGN